jgi:hypothetical protein
LLATFQFNIVGPLRQPRGARAFALEAEAGASVGSLLELAGYRPEEARRVQVLVQGRTLAHSEIAPEEVEMTLFIPMGGG